MVGASGAEDLAGQTFLNLLQKNYFFDLNFKEWILDTSTIS